MIALVRARLIDGTDADPLDDATVVVDGRRIAGVAAGSTPPAEAHVIDLQGLTLLPGLVDSHVHFGGFIIDDPDWTFSYWSILPFFWDYLRGFAARRRLAIEHGVTMIRSAGDNFPHIIELREKIDAGRLVGPRIVAAGPIFTAPGGHPAGTIYRRNRYIVEHATRQVESVHAARTEVRRLAERGVDVVKAVYSDVNPFDLAHPVPKLGRPILAALADEAHCRGLRLMVHTGNPDDTLDAVKAGADSIEHGILPGAQSTVFPEALATMMRDRGTYLVPTLCAAWAMQRMHPGALPEAVHVVRALHGHGVEVALGTDAGAPGVVLGKAAHMELALLVECGLRPQEAIIAGTRNAATNLARADDLGTVAPGKLADLVAVAGDPLTDIACTRSIRLVIRDGEIVVNRLQ